MVGKGDPLMSKRILIIATDGFEQSELEKPKANLEAAAEGEKEEWSVLYAQFAKTAHEEGYPEIAKSFEEIAEVEQFHEQRYRKLLANVVNNEVFKKAAPVKWHCINCGYIHEGTEAPEECPACRHPRAYYEVLAENY